VLCLAHPDAERSLFDIPIGLKQDSDRLLEKSVRLALGHRKSSVFPVPCHPAAYAENYAEASSINRQQIGKGLSKQAWFICPRIRDVDRLLRSEPSRRSIIGECHPELAFTLLNGAPLDASKKTPAGQRQRRQIIERHLPDLTLFIDKMLKQFPRRDLLLDDIFDALVLAITAKKATILPAEPETGVGDIPIRMWVPDY
jgi:predicted RNase H-like nuclease